MNEQKLKNILFASGALFLTLYCIAPFAYMLVISVSRNPDFLSGQDGFEFTLHNFKSVLTSKSLRFPDYLRNSLVISAVSAVLSVMIASLGAYSITRLPLPGKTAVLLAILAMSMFPQISLVGYLFSLMAKLNLINTYPALILPYIAWIMPLSLWILSSYFQQIPRELDKAAAIDGCSSWQTLRKVILPVAVPGIVSTCLLAFIFSFNEFMFALMLTTDYRARTIPVGIALFQGMHGELPWGSIMAASAITTIPVVLLAVIFQKRIIQGLTMGAVKG